MLFYVSRQHENFSQPKMHKQITEAGNNKLQDKSDFLRFNDKGIHRVLFVGAWDKFKNFSQLQKLRKLQYYLSLINHKNNKSMTVSEDLQSQPWCNRWAEETPIRQREKI